MCGGWIEVGEMEGVETEGGLALPWAELVSFGMDFWSQEVVEEALGAEVAEAIPELLRLTELEVRIPRMEVVALERLAARDGQTVSAVLARELRDLVSVHSAVALARGAGIRGGVALARAGDGCAAASLLIDAPGKPRRRPDGRRKIAGEC